MMTPKKHLLMTLWLPILAVLLSHCVKLDVDPPEQWERPADVAFSVHELLGLFTGTPIEFQGNEYVDAVVTMDDKSGNIYRSAFVQDGTAAVNLRLVAPGGLYRGDSIRIFLKGTTLSSYQRMMQLDNVNVDKHIQKLGVMREVQPRTLSIPAILGGNHLAELVRLNNVQFAAADTGKPFADSENLLSINRMLEDESGNQIIVRTSGYARFADRPVPSGSGDLIAVVAQYGRDIQLYIRDFNEVRLDDDRIPTPGDDFTRWSLANIRQNFSEGATQIPPNIRIEGVVISDRSHSNHPGQNLYLMDESGAGLALRFNSFHSFPLGQRIRVIVSNMRISEFNGLLQIDNIPNGNAYDLGTGVLPEPQTASIADITGNLGRYESTLVRIRGATISGGNRFRDNLSISDGTGQMMLYTTSYASFADNQVPGEAVEITGIVSVFNNPQLLIRNLDDIVPE